MKKMLLIFFAILFIGCSDYKFIDEKTMEDIICEAFITQAIRDADPELRSITKTADSVDLYQPILQRRGFTMGDFRYTVSQMATRKSNPMNAVLDRVVAKIDVMARSADENYGAFLRYDSLAVATFADTVYRYNDTLKGSVKKFKIQLKDIRSGQYKLQFNYVSTGAVGVTPKTIAYGIGDSSKVGHFVPKTGVISIPMMFKPSEFSNTIDVVRGRDTLNFRFLESKAIKGTKAIKTVKDTSYISRIRVVYMPFVSRARRDYYIKSSGLTKYIFNNEDAQDSLTLYTK